ncbi:MAG TPA: diaminopimelate epimerase [Terriglobia bacterium]|nr:diaminopimelate epimerase [Terriglobia bacterium]
MALRTLRFAKLEGSGNDFLVVEDPSGVEQLDTEFVQRICDRHLGIGADGLVAYTGLPDGEAHLAMRLFNADGSEAEISGNGLRCLAARIFHRGLHAATELRVQTRAGIKRVQKISASGTGFTFEVEMGLPILDPAKIPFRLAPPAESLIGCRLQVGEEIYSVTVTSMGNPHCSIFLDSFEGLDWKGVGRRIEVHPAFPEKTNVEFIRIVNTGTIEVLFWERGVGTTLSSGTGACAATVASVLNGFVSRKVRVMTRGGELEIEWGSDGILKLVGPVKMICEGEYLFDDGC